MAITERDRYRLGYSAQIYEELLLAAKQEQEKIRLARRQQVIKAEDAPWENSRHGRIKHFLNDNMNCPIRDLNLYMLLLPPGARSGKHRHMSEEILFILEGQGYDIHWDPDLELTDKPYWHIKENGARYEWAEGDFVYIPPMTAHQHFNASTSQQVRLMAASQRLYGFLGFPGLEQLEDAPEYSGL
ncbi:MAG: hypothetical protein HY673_00855 [Chloroflexi bacterium]|nr:hypothetical protein [Chloroflexota bacterium]